MVRRLEHHELERNSLCTELIFSLLLDTVHFFLTILAAHLCRRIPQDVTVAHSDQLNLIIVRKVYHLKQVHDSMLKVRHF